MNNERERQQAAIDAAFAAHRSGNHAAAETAYRAVLAQWPELATGWNLLGALLHQCDRTAEAAECLARAVALSPQVPSFAANLAEVLRLLGRLDEALALAQRALQLAPEHAECHHKLGLVLGDLRQSEAAIACYQRTVQLNAQHAEAYLNWGCELTRLNRPQEALPLFVESLRLQPQSALAENNLGAALSLLERAPEACAHYRRALAFKPQFREAFSNLLFASNYDATLAPEALSAAHLEFGRSLASMAAPVAAWGNDRAPERRLRIAYFTADTRRHPVAHFLLPLLRMHDRRVCDVRVYTDGLQHDDMTVALRSASDAWVSTATWSDERLVTQARADAIDVAIDLAGHTTGNRLAAFAHRMAPVQVSYLGYVNTTGLAQLDFRVTDAICDPPHEPSLYSEQLVRLSRHFSCYTPWDDAPPVSPLPALHAGHVTFGSLHNLSKLGPATIALWSQVLRAVPTARLLIVRQALTAELQARLLDAFAAHGIAAERLDFACDWSGPSHLSRYEQIDLTLDVVPWSGHTTACEALWQGVPIVTLPGNRYAGRMVSSVLECLGLEEWIASKPAEFVAIATRFASDIPHLAALREQLRGTLAGSALLDGAGLARELEAAYRNMWRTWCSTAS